MKQSTLHHSDYAGEIKLFDSWQTDSGVLSVPEQEQIVGELLDILKDHASHFAYSPSWDYKEKRQVLHAVLNTLAPETLGSAQIVLLDQLLQAELAQKRITAEEDLIQEKHLLYGNTKLIVWQGDICTLRLDAIVNAANSQMLGCFQPLHACIDNAIHSAAGVQLRDDCNTIMQKQGFAEPTGTAKITRAYNLPSKFVLHTVGPIVRGQVSAQNREDLASAYTACLKICREIESIRSIAFCGISTGVFGYPQTLAAELALETVSSWIIDNPDHFDLVIFNVFSDKDREIYKALVENR